MQSEPHSTKQTPSSPKSNSFWKVNTSPLPGSVKPVYTYSSTVQEPTVASPANSLLLEAKMPSSPRKQNKSSVPKSSFQQYEENTLDAWDDGDDDLLTRLKLDTSVIRSTANQVIENHSQRSALNGNQSETTAVRKQSPTSQQKLKKTVASKLPMSDAQVQREQGKIQKFDSIINGRSPNLLDDLRKLSWSGVPLSCRPITWKILCGYLPAAADRRKMTLDRKRQEYFGFLEQYFHTRHEEQYQDIFRQIHIDVPRMNPLIPLFQTKRVQEIFERILYIWAIRHPASGYVQGINDLVTPFFVVFLTEFLNADVESDHIDIDSLSKEQLETIEADSYWCMSKLLDGIQDNYTFAQPGIQKKVAALKDLTQRIDETLHNHIESQSIEFLQFTFRWMNNLLMRELPLRCTIRLWDTYLAEPDGFASFHLYVCAAFLTRFSKPLLAETDFQGLMMLLQNLPTQRWQDEEIGELTAEAYKLKYMFADSPQHLKNRT